MNKKPQKYTKNLTTYYKTLLIIKTEHLNYLDQINNLISANIKLF